MDRIFSSSPMNKTAALVTGKGEHYVSKKKIVTSHHANPIPTRKAPQVDLTGLRVGRLTVKGLSRDTPKRWVVRCDCGMFSLRTARAIRNPNNGTDCCEECRQFLFLKHLEKRPNQ